MNRTLWNLLLVLATFGGIVGAVVVAVSFPSGVLLAWKLSEVSTPAFGSFLGGAALIALFGWVLAARARWFRRVGMYRSFRNLKEAAASAYSDPAPTDEERALLRQLADRIAADPADLAAIFTWARSRGESSPEGKAEFHRTAEAIYRVLAHAERPPWA